MRQHKVAQENEASAERARLEASELRDLEREFEGLPPITVDRHRGLRDRLRHRSA